MAHGPCPHAHFTFPKLTTECFGSGVPGPGAVYSGAVAGAAQQGSYRALLRAPASPNMSVEALHSGLTCSSPQLALTKRLGVSWFLARSPRLQIDPHPIPPRLAQASPVPSDSHRPARVNSPGLCHDIPYDISPFDMGLWPMAHAHMHISHFPN